MISILEYPETRLPEDTEENAIWSPLIIAAAEKQDLKLLRAIGRVASSFNRSSGLELLVKDKKATFEEALKFTQSSEPLTRILKFIQSKTADSKEADK